MKIVVDARTMGSKPSGVGMYIFNFLKEMITNEQYEIVLLSDVATSKEMQYMKQHGVKILEYGQQVYQSAAVFKYFAFVNSKLKEIRPDLFWEPNNLIPSRIARFGGKIMVTVHDVFPITHREYFGIKYIAYFRIMLAKTVKMADMIVYNSLETKNSVEHFYKVAIRKQNHVGYIPFEGVGSSQISSMDGKNPYFLYIGNMEARKGVDLLIHGYEQYMQLGGTKGLVLAGKSREQKIDAMIEKLVAKHSKVEYLGYVDDETKNCLMQQCDCFVFPSRAEGFGMAVLEAMQYAKPIIVSDLNIFREIVGDCLNYFPMTGNDEEQAKELANLMLRYDAKVKVDEYENARKKYLPEILNRGMMEFIEKSVK